MKQSWPYRWDLLLRYRLIEIIAYWEGRLTTNHLCNTFGIGRQQASKDINTYLREVAPGNLVYDTKLKGYKPSSTFKATVTQAVADEYLHILSNNQDINHTFEGMNIGSANTEVFQAPIRTANPKILRAIVRAAREEKRLDIGYLSIASPKAEDRIISPHTLVFTGLRWHVRAYCEKNRDFRDFVISRFRGKPEMMDKALVPSSQDERWHTHIPLIIAPDTRLSEDQQKVIAGDYGMRRNQLKISVRAALMEYALQALNIDLHKVEAKPEAQQIIVINLEEVEKWTS